MPARTTEQELEVYRRRLQGPAVRANAEQGRQRGEDKAVALLRAIKAAGLPGIWCREVTFHEARNFRLDIGCVDGRKLGVEIDGGVHRLKGKFLRDMEKHNELTILGWKWIRCTPAQVDSGEALVLLEALVREVV